MNYQKRTNFDAGNSIIIYVVMFSAFLAGSLNVWLPAFAKAQDYLPVADQDNDGLSDFQEINKYLTNPMNNDSDSDGTPDGEWRERREYQYTIRSVVQVMKPVTIDYLSDDYQDARVLDETESYVELEVIHYPFNTVSSTISHDMDWRNTVASMQEWIKPGPSSDWTPDMQRRLKDELLKDGIDTSRLSDGQIAERVSRWLCDWAQTEDGIVSFVTGWNDAGHPFVPNQFMDSVDALLKRENRNLEEQWAREVSAKGMFDRRTRGTCTSSAIYLSGCLKAVGLPTRTILCIPIIDASDDAEWKLLNNIQQPAVRQHLRRSLKRLKNSWASHTFNEVFVGGRWHRLNYSRLGQGIYDQKLFGLITHVATFKDWADAEFYKTVGRRQKTGQPKKKDVFGHLNPYSTISLRDELGIHCKVDIPVHDEQNTVVYVDGIYWTDDESLPSGIVENCRNAGRFGLIAKLSGFGDDLEGFLKKADMRVFLLPNAGGKKRIALKVGFDAGCRWANGESCYIFVPFGPADRRDLELNVAYRFEPQNLSESHVWELREGLQIVRKNGKSLDN